MDFFSRNHRYFLKVVECGSITEAARALRIGQSTLSLAMAKFEEELGVSLFAKDGRRLMLTAAAQEFGQALKVGGRYIEAQCASALSRGKEKPIRVGIAMHLAEKYLLPRWKDFEANFGPIQGHFGYSLPILEQVKRGELDFAFITWMREPKWLHRSFLREDHEGVVGLKGKFDHIKRAKSLHDLRTEPWIWHRKPQNHLIDYAKPLDGVLVLDGYPMVKNFLFLGVGIAIVQLDAFTEKELARLVVNRLRRETSIGVYQIHSGELTLKQKQAMGYIHDLLK